MCAYTCAHMHTCTHTVKLRGGGGYSKRSVVTSSLLLPRTVNFYFTMYMGYTAVYMHSNVCDIFQEKIRKIKFVLLKIIIFLSVVACSMLWFGVKVRKNGSMLVPAQSFNIAHTIANHILLPLVYNTNPLKEQTLTMQKKKKQTIRLYYRPIKHNNKHW